MATENLSQTTVDILAIAAHRDDVEQTCGGTLIRMAEAGYRAGVLDLTAGECMTLNPKTIAGHELAAGALNIMEEKKITSLVVTGGSGEVEGIIHLHDLWGTQMV